MRSFYIVLLLSLLFENVWAKEEQNITNDLVTEIKVDKLLRQKDDILREIIENNIWSKIYSNYHIYTELKKEKLSLDTKIKKLKKLRSRSKKQKNNLSTYQDKLITINGKLKLLEEYKSDPFKKFLTPPRAGRVPKIDSPFAIISALSFKEKIESDVKEYEMRYLSLESIMKKFKEKEEIIQSLLNLQSHKKSYKEEYKDIQAQLKTFRPVLEIFKTTKIVYSKKIEEIKFKINTNIKKEINRTIVILGVILFFIFILFIIKSIVKRYMADNDRVYSINKALNISFVLILLFTLLFAYIENVSYLITIMGFASAGIAIAMKDWFMSLMGWVTIIMSGSIHVGDRVKFVKDGFQYVGDIIDISMLRITIQEDVTLTTYTANRRAGRIIFVPNNFIFTDIIANYSHAGLKTVWDGIDFYVTFDSNIRKASLIAKEVTRKYSKGYTDITRKQLNKLRSQYSIKNTNVEPRVLTFIEPYGMKISAWYLTNSYATLTLRSTISLEIINRINAESDIDLAFPTQSIYIDKNVPKPTPNDETATQGVQV